MENRTDSVIVQKFLSSVSDVSQDLQAQISHHRLSHYPTDLGFRYLRLSHAAVPRSQCCSYFTRDTLMQRSDPEKQQKDPRCCQTCRHPHTGPPGPGQGPQQWLWWQTCWHPGLPCTTKSGVSPAADLWMVVAAVVVGVGQSRQQISGSYSATVAAVSAVAAVGKVSPGNFPQK